MGVEYGWTQRGGVTMARINKSTLTKLEIIRVASRMFLECGYSSATIKAISKELEMSAGNLTFYFPTKEHLLAELTEMLCVFQWELMAQEADEKGSSLMARCLELAAMAAMCEENRIAREFYLAAYTSPTALNMIRESDSRRAQQIFGDDLPSWTEADFREAEVLVSGIEYGTLMTTGDSPPLELRITSALNIIMQLYQVPEQTRKMTIDQVLTMDYRRVGRRVFKEFAEFVEQSSEQAIEGLLSLRK